MLDDRTAFTPKKTMSLKTYRKMKLKMLSRDFCITLTQEELDHVNELTSEIAIDNFCISVINNHWN